MKDLIKVAEEEKQEENKVTDETIMKPTTEGIC